MQIVNRQGWAEAACGLQPERVLIFTAQEQAALRRASAIAQRARELARREIGPEFEQDPADLLLGEVSCNPSEFIDGIVLREAAWKTAQ